LNLTKGEHHDRYLLFWFSSINWDAGWSLNKARNEGDFAKALETGVNSTMFKGDAETTYAAIVCRSIGNPQPTLLPSDGKSVLLGALVSKIQLQMMVLVSVLYLEVVI